MEKNFFVKVKLEAPSFMKKGAKVDLVMIPFSYPKVTQKPLPSWVKRLKIKSVIEQKHSLFF